jgi:hypothetical protein
VNIRGLEARSTDLARGIVVLRSRRALDGREQARIVGIMADAGMTEPPDDHVAPERVLVAAPWAPPRKDELAAHQAAVESLAEPFEIEQAWFVKIETGIDGVAWAELAAEAEAEQRLIDGDAGRAADENEDAADLAEGEALAAAAAEAAGEPQSVDDDEPSVPEVVYSAPGAPPDDDEDNLEAQQDAEDEVLEVDASDLGPEVESHWRHGPPPTESSVPFPIERFPEIVEEFEWDDFGLAVKLAGAEVAGEDSVINAFFALWLSVYHDERAEDFEPFAHADVVHDRPHRSALLWIDRFTVPATPGDQIGFMLWIAGRMHEIIPIAWARFDQSDLPSRYRSLDGDDSPPFVLAGNPLAERFRLLGEAAAMSWAVAQSLWDRREIAGMLIELAITNDPDDPEQAAVAERLLLRASDLDGRSDAGGYLSTVMVRQQRFDDALHRVAASPDPELRLHLIGESVEHAVDRAGDAIDLLDEEAAYALPDDELAETASRIAEHAPSWLGSYLSRLPTRSSLVPHLYNASFPVEREQSLEILGRVLELPEPPASDDAGRAAYVMAWNNACIHAHALGDFDRACTLADGAQRFAAENPYIYHSAACAYAAAGRLDQALAQVKAAIEHGYDHIEKMEVDRDLGPLLGEPQFKALFSDWRSERADLN